MNESSTIDLHSKITQASGNIVSDMGEEKVMLNIVKGKYYNLGAIGGMIWSKIESPLTVGELVQNIMQEYEIDEIQCKREVLLFLDQLNKEKLIMCL